MYANDRPLIICPLDDTLISGPVNGLESPATKLRSIAAAGPTAILTFGGLVERHYESFVGRRYILNLSASTSRSRYTRKVPIGTVEGAIGLAPAAVAVHVNLSSRYAGEMLSAAGQVVEQARRFGCPTVGILYPRGETGPEERTEEFDELRASDPSAFATLIGHCVQVGVDLGFDLIKTQYTGSEETFRRVMDVAGSVPVVVAGGPLIEEDTAIAAAAGAVRAGAGGISFARNVFGRAEPSDFLVRIRAALEDVWTPRS